ncbi:MAG: hypothetical protein K0Q59_5687, partial [Paenibacillus sp.]|nr:hypothetical protein [Paenibacillus sp.]
MRRSDNNYVHFGHKHEPVRGSILSI